MAINMAIGIAIASYVTETIRFVFLELLSNVFNINVTFKIFPKLLF